MRLSHYATLALRGALAASSVLVAGLLTLGTSAHKTYDATGQFSGFSLTATEACAYDPAMDGSCSPQAGWICGLNGVNYPEKMYLKPM